MFCDVCRYFLTKDLEGNRVRALVPTRKVIHASQATRTTGPSLDTITVLCKCKISSGVWQPWRLPTLACVLEPMFVCVAASRATYRSKKSARKT